MEESKKSGSGYKVVTWILVVLLIIGGIAFFLYWQDVEKTQDSQQAEIDNLNQQIDDAQTNINDSIDEAQDSAEERRQEIEDNIEDSQNSADESAEPDMTPETQPAQ